MEEIIKILMRRDGMTREEAKELIEEVQEAILDDPDNGCEIFESELGLEPDYLINFLLT